MNSLIDRVRQKKGFLVVSSASISEKFINLLTFFGFSYWLSPDDYGLFAISWIVIAIAESFFDFSMGLGFMQDQRKFSGYINIYNGALLICAIFWLMVCWLVTLIVWFSGFHEVSLIIATLSAIFVFRAMTQASLSYFSLNQNYGMLVCASLLSAVIGGLVGLVLAVKQFGVWALVSRHVAAAFVIGVFVWLFSPCSMRPEFDLVKTKEWFLKGWKFAVSNNLGWLVVYQVEQLLVAGFLGAAVLGVYNYAKKPVDITGQLFAQVSRQYFIPLFIREKSGVAIAFRWSLFVFLIMVLAVIVLMLLVNQFAYQIWPEKWWPAFDLLPVAMLALPLVAVDSIMLSSLAASSQVHSILKINLAATFLSVSVALWCVLFSGQIKYMLIGAIVIFMFKIVCYCIALVRSENTAAIGPFANQATFETGIDGSDMDESSMSKSASNENRL